MEKLIANWLHNGYHGDCYIDYYSKHFGNGESIGYGLSDENGYGGNRDNCDSGYGGNRSSYGNGYGDKHGNGYGNGVGDSLLSYNGEKVYYIDSIPTLIKRLNVKRDIASGYIIEALGLKPCYVAKVHGYFAHGETVRSAYIDAFEKWKRDTPLEDRIAEFIKQYPSLDTLVDNEALFSWHNVLTGSCEMGRKSFAAQHDIDIENGTMTVGEFINLTINAYGGDAIKQLKQMYNLKDSHDS